MIAQLGLKGPHLLDEPTLDSILEADKIGNYAVGNLNEKGEFIPKRVGRSDLDLKKELLQWIPFHQYSHFAYAYTTSAKLAYEKECHNYHDLFPFLNNPPHPAKPEGGNYKCPNKWCDR